MAVIAELIQAGLRLKQGGNLGGAIEHFKQLHATYPEHARIKFELAGCWREFGVPEQALPLYRELLALPKSQGLPPKDLPRLYTQLGATLLEMGNSAEGLSVIEEGLRLYPSYRSLRAWRIFSLSTAGEPQSALQDALELMLESLAPSRWDIFEAEIKEQVKAMRSNLTGHDALPKAGSADLEATSSAQQEEASEKPEQTEKRDDATAGNAERQQSRIEVTSDALDATETDVSVNLVKRAKKKKPRRKRNPRPQMGKKAVRIDISGEADASQEDGDEGDNSTAAGAFKIPIDSD